MPTPNPSPDPTKNLNAAFQVSKSKEECLLGRIARQQSDLSPSVSGPSVVGKPSSLSLEPRTRLQIQVAAQRDSAVKESLSPSTSSSSTKSDTCIDEGKRSESESGHCYVPYNIAHRN